MDGLALEGPTMNTEGPLCSLKGKSRVLFGNAILGWTLSVFPMSGFL
jgi:hypothetical protein